MIDFDKPIIFLNVSSWLCSICIQRQKHESEREIAFAEIEVTCPICDDSSDRTAGRETSSSTHHYCPGTNGERLVSAPRMTDFQQKRNRFTSQKDRWKLTQVLLHKHTFQIDPKGIFFALASESRANAFAS
jgi:hypothetical protein